MPDTIYTLRTQGIQPTPQRIAVAEYVLQTKTHPSADEVWEEVQRTCPTISRGTVYNTLNLFVEKGLLQPQLLREGTIHNYLRMLWGKKILEWTSEPREALEVMIELNNRYALDGRDPNSYTGIFWVLGRHDRPWGPERPIFGKVRYMSSANTARKFPVRQYLDRYSGRN